MTIYVTDMRKQDTNLWEQNGLLINLKSIVSVALIHYKGKRNSTRIILQ